MKKRYSSPWGPAVLTLCIALVPVWLAWTSYRNEAKRKDVQIFEASSGLVSERLQLITVRHLNTFQILRNQMRNQDSPTLESLRTPPNFRKLLPHLSAFGYASTEADRVILQWTNADENAPVRKGSDLKETSRYADAIQRAARNPNPVVTVDFPSNRLFVVLAADRAAPASTFVVGWIDIASLCVDDSVPLLRDGVLVAAPLAKGSKAPQGTKVFFIREGGEEFSVTITRGPKFAASYGQVAPWWMLVTGIGCAVLLSFLVFEVIRASRLRAALDAERMRGQLVQSFSHEFRTPLSVILSSADLLEADDGRIAPERRGEIISQIQESTKQLADMAEEILLLSRLDSPSAKHNPVPLELRSFCESLARDASSAARHSIGIDVAVEGEAVLDPALLRPSLANLLANAIKYSEPGDTVKLSTVQRQGEIVFTVSDQGIGIPADDLARVGDPFHRASNVGHIPGTGLGLAIVIRSVNLMGGRLDLQSEEGCGTTAKLIIPIS